MTDQAKLNYAKIRERLKVNLQKECPCYIEAAKDPEGFIGANFANRSPACDTCYQLGYHDVERCDGWYRYGCNMDPFEAALTAAAEAELDEQLLAQGCLIEVEK